MYVAVQFRDLALVHIDSIVAFLACRGVSHGGGEHQVCTTTTGICQLHQQFGDCSVGASSPCGLMSLLEHAGYHSLGLPNCSVGNLYIRISLSNVGDETIACARQRGEKVESFPFGFPRCECQHQPSKHS